MIQSEKQPKFKKKPAFFIRLLFHKPNLKADFYMVLQDLSLILFT